MGANAPITPDDCAHTMGTWTCSITEAFNQLVDTFNYLESLWDGEDFESTCYRLTEQGKAAASSLT